MANQLKFKNKLDRQEGLLLINKPSGPSSYDVIRGLKKVISGKVKIGHAGTLDPLASGLLIMGLGRSATRLLGKLIYEDKTYLATAHFGQVYDTQDITGKLIKETDISQLSLEDISQAAVNFQGEIYQQPPMYSALKYKGQPLYKLARAGQRIEVKSRLINIYSLVILGWQPPLLDFEVKCSSGTYIRTLAHDWGQILGVGATISSLCRLTIGRFLLSEAHLPAVFSSEEEINSRLISVNGLSKGHLLSP